MCVLLFFVDKKPWVNVWVNQRVVLTRTDYEGDFMVTWIDKQQGVHRPVTEAGGDLQQGLSLVVFIVNVYIDIYIWGFLKYGYPKIDSL